MITGWILCRKSTRPAHSSPPESIWRRQSPPITSMNRASSPEAGDVVERPCLEQTLQYRRAIATTTAQLGQTVAHRLNGYKAHGQTRVERPLCPAGMHEPAHLIDAQLRARNSDPVEHRDPPIRDAASLIDMADIAWECGNVSIGHHACGQQSILRAQVPQGNSGVRRERRFPPCLEDGGA